MFTFLDLFAAYFIGILVIGFVCGTISGTIACKKANKKKKKEFIYRHIPYTHYVESNTGLSYWAMEAE